LITVRLPAFAGRPRRLLDCFLLFRVAREPAAHGRVRRQLLHALGRVARRSPDPRRDFGDHEVDREPENRQPDAAANERVAVGHVAVTRNLTIVSGAPGCGPRRFGGKRRAPGNFFACGSAPGGHHRTMLQVRDRRLVAAPGGAQANSSITCSLTKSTSLIRTATGWPSVKESDLRPLLTSSVGPLTSLLSPIARAGRNPPTL